MMVPKSLILAGAALALFGSTATAQQKAFKRVNKPMKAHTIDLATGTITRGMSTQNRVAGSAVFISTDMFNLDLGGFIAADTGGGFCEWFTAGTKGFTGNTSDLMSSVVFAYCSAAFTANSGGPGSTTKLGFYENYFAGNSPSTAVNTVFSMTLTGLPGNTGSSSFFGGCTPHAVRLFVGGLICFVDGPVGYSWKFLDNGTGTLASGAGAGIAATFPWLSCVNSCSSTSNTQVDGQGMINKIDQFCPPGFLRSSFSFGTAQSINSLNMSIEELDDITSATIANSNSGTQPNPDFATADPVIIGKPWTASVTLGLSRTKSTSWVMFFGTSTVNPPNGSAAPQFTNGFNFGSSKAGRMILCAMNTTGGSVTAPIGGTVGATSTSPAIVIPVDFALVCNSWCGQAVVLGGGVSGGGGGNARLTSLTGGRIGTNP